MILFIICDGWEKKTRNIYKAKIKEKIPRLVALPSLVYEKMEADCFPVSENKPDLP